MNDPDLSSGTSERPPSKTRRKLNDFVSLLTGSVFAAAIRKLFDELFK
jgi:hypothetical protein